MVLYTVQCASNKGVVPSEGPTGEVSRTSCVTWGDSYRGGACGVGRRRVGGPYVIETQQEGKLDVFGSTRVDEEGLEARRVDEERKESEMPVCSRMVDTHRGVTWSFPSLRQHMHKLPYTSRRA